MACSNCRYRLFSGPYRIGQNRSCRFNIPIDTSTYIKGKKDILIISIAAIAFAISWLDYRLGSWENDNLEHFFLFFSFWKITCFNFGGGDFSVSGTVDMVKGLVDWKCFSFERDAWRSWLTPVSFQMFQWVSCNGSIRRRMYAYRTVQPSHSSV